MEPRIPAAALGSVSMARSRAWNGSSKARSRPTNERSRQLRKTFTQTPITETVVEEHRPAFLGRLRGRQPTSTETEQVVGSSTRRNYR